MLVVDSYHRQGWAEAEAAIRRSLHPRLALEVWNEQTLSAAIKDRLGIRIDAIMDHCELLDVRERIENQFKGNARNWPFGAALSFLLMYATFAAIALRAYLTRGQSANGSHGI